MTYANSMDSQTHTFRVFDVNSGRECETSETVRLPNSLKKSEAFKELGMSRSTFYRHLGLVFELKPSLKGQSNARTISRDALKAVETVAHLRQVCGMIGTEIQEQIIRGRVKL